MKVVILTGGYGMRIAEYTQRIPKPMIKIGGIPMLTHIMRIFTSYGFKNFIILEWSSIRIYFAKFNEN